MAFMHYDEERRMCVKTDVSVACVVCSGFIGAKRDNGKNDIIQRYETWKQRQVNFVEEVKAKERMS